VTYPNSDTTDYTYDAQGNRLTMTTNGTTTLDYTYDDADQMTDVEGTTYDYDDNGNRTDGGADTYDWDHENRLVASSVDSVSASYEYNGAGLRTSRTVGATTVGFVWDQNASLPVVLRDTAGNRYVYGLDLLTRINGTDEEWYLTDGLGSTTALADAVGDVTGTYTYDVFGAVRSHTGDDTEWSYTGEQNDPTGLEYLRARYYESETGRFLSQDPLPLIDRYAYVGNNAATMIDPTGLRARTFTRQVLAYTSRVLMASFCWVGKNQDCSEELEWQRKMLLWAKRCAVGVAVGQQVVAAGAMMAGCAMGLASHGARRLELHRPVVWLDDRLAGARSWTTNNVPCLEQIGDYYNYQVTEVLEGIVLSLLRIPWGYRALDDFNDSQEANRLGMRYQKTCNLR
jgi:RHS repeat-associated protein